MLFFLFMPKAVHEQKCMLFGCIMQDTLHGQRKGTHTDAKRQANVFLRYSQATIDANAMVQAE